MSRPPFEVADIIHIAARTFRERYAAFLTWPQVKVLEAIARCPTAALGGHRDLCSRCGHEAISYNWCRNRHCPKCQSNAGDKWLPRRQQELLPVGYYHLVFSVPHVLVPLMWQNKRRLFHCGSKLVLPPFSKWPSIPNPSVPKPASSPFCTLGDRSSKDTRISTVLFPVAVYLPTTPTGFQRAPVSSCP